MNRLTALNRWGVHVRELLRICGMVVISNAVIRADFVVAPNDRATQSGNGSATDGFAFPATIQSVYGTLNFSNPVSISAVSYRLDEGAGGPFLSSSISRLVIQMSTYAGSFGLFNPNSYEFNKGADNTVVFDGPVNWVGNDIPGGAPNPFEFRVQLSRPFLYDPKAGALLLNFSSSGSFSSSLSADFHNFADSTIGWSGENGQKFFGLFVTQFEVTSIPEAEPLYLVLSSTLFIGLSLKRFGREGVRLNSH